METSSAYETLLTRVWVRKVDREGRQCGPKVVGYEFEPPTQGLPYIVYFPGGNVFRTSHVEGLSDEGGQIVLTTRNSTYRIEYPQGAPSRTCTDLERFVRGARHGRGARGGTVTATQELPARKISLAAVARGGGGSEEPELVGWETAPPQEGEPYVAYLERGGIFQTSTVQEVQEAEGGILLRTRNSLYRVRYLGAGRP
jgi:hypothetical protein